jgi:hypothetical protein
MRKIALLTVLPLLLGSIGLADEIVSFYSIPSQAGSGVMSYTAGLTGGYTLGNIDWNGFAVPIHENTYGSELTLDISGPLGAATFTLGSGSQYVGGAWFSGVNDSFFGAGDPAGTWTFDFYESYDDGGDGLPDATWDEIHFTFNEYVMKPAIYTFNMDSDPGWTMDGGSEWQFGAPMGLGGEHGNPDPTSAYSGNNVYGYDLTGLGAQPGDYEANMPATLYLTTTALDFSGYTDVEVEFQRWLNVESPSYDHAYLEVSNDGVNWTVVWENGEQLTDDSWRLASYDISDVADGESTVYIRWGIGPTDSSWFFSGWNIDDVVFRGIPEPASLLLLGLGAVLLRRR